MVINLRGLDKYESNHTGDGQTGRKTGTEVRTLLGYIERTFKVLVEKGR